MWAAVPGCNLRGKERICYYPALYTFIFVSSDSVQLAHKIIYNSILKRVKAQTTGTKDWPTEAS